MDATQGTQGRARMHMASLCPEAGQQMPVIPACQHCDRQRLPAHLVLDGLGSKSCLAPLPRGAALHDRCTINTGRRTEASLATNPARFRVGTRCVDRAVAPQVLWASSSAIHLSWWMPPPGAHLARQGAVFVHVALVVLTLAHLSPLMAPTLCSRGTGNSNSLGGKWQNCAVASCVPVSPTYVVAGVRQLQHRVHLLKLLHQSFRLRQHRRQKWQPKDGAQWYASRAEQE